jgi:4-alpha-glucanotransferase
MIMHMDGRYSGVLLPISSLLDKHGIGTFGKGAHDFVDFLSASGMSIRQILPLNVTSYGDSPYQSPSTYGLNHYFIDLDLLRDDGLLKESDYDSIDFGSNPSRVDYGKLYLYKLDVLKVAFKNFDKSDRDFVYFLKNNLKARDYALFMVLKTINEMKPWWKRAQEYRNYSLKLEEDVINEHSDPFTFYVWTQFEFLKQYHSLKEYANSKGILIMGDMPIYVAYDSLECRKYPENFLFDKDKKPTLVAGCPPDCFSNDGQLWGNPIWNREYLKSTGYKRYNDRISFCLELFDLLRIDHFRGFSGYYAIPSSEKTARNGKWIKGPGIDLFADKLNWPIVAEDLGYEDEDLKIFLKQCSYPRMKIATQGLLDLSKDDVWRPSNYTYNFFAYTSTHDSPTVREFLDELEPSDFKTIKEVVKEECSLLKVKSPDDYSNKDELVETIIRLDVASAARVAMIPMQDILGIGKAGRMNVPSTLSDLNRSRRLPQEWSESDHSELALKLKALSLSYGREIKCLDRPIKSFKKDF